MSPSINYTEEATTLQAKLQGEAARIYKDHAPFNGVHALYEADGQQAYMILKKRNSHRRKF